jgi:hypothetical protein
LVIKKKKKKVLMLNIPNAYEPMPNLNHPDAVYLKVKEHHVREALSFPGQRNFS